MMTLEDFKAYLKNNGEIVLYDSLGRQDLINVELKTERLYYLVWSPRENTGEPRKYITLDKAKSLIAQNKPNLYAELFESKGL